MRRAGRLIERIADSDNLRLAFLKARRGKQGKAEVIRFRENLDDELSRLRGELAAGHVAWGEYHRFKVFDPKERIICAAPFRARVAHHAIMNVCEPVFESYQVFDSYACRRNKGLDPALARAMTFARAGGWYMKMDVRRYFDSVDHRILRTLLSRRFKDRIVLELFDSILDT